MRRLFLLALLVPLASGCGWANLLFGGSGSSSTHTATAIRVYPTAPSSVPRWIKVEHLPKRAVRGAVIFSSSGCTACHTYAGSGSSNLHAPDLTAVGARSPGVTYFVRVLTHRPSLDQAMPDFASLGKKRLHQLAVFLEASKGIR
jgi:hypothetical protein